MEQFPVPRISQCSKTTAPTSKFTQSQELLRVAHAKYKYAGEPWLAADPISAKRFVKELESVQLTFPSINDDSMIFGMAA
jgi:hypothetical protein